MTEFEHLLAGSPADLQGDPPYDEEELAKLRTDAWRMHRVFIVQILDPRLTEDERLTLFGIASRLYEGEDVDA